MGGGNTESRINAARSRVPPGVLGARGGAIIAAGAEVGWGSYTELRSR